MCKWVKVSDPTSQAESRRVPYSSGIIGDQTPVDIPATLYRDIKLASSDGQAVFSLIAGHMSKIFPSWKGTRADFRFANSEGTVVFVLTPKRKFIRVEIRTDVTGYSDRNGLFPAAPSAGAQYPGIWIRSNVTEIAVAEALVHDLEKYLR